MQADDFQRWAELAAGDEDRIIYPLISVAQELKTTPNEVMRVAVDLKRESAGIYGRPVLWLAGVPWFNVPEVDRIRARLAEENVRAAVAVQAARN